VDDLLEQLRARHRKQARESIDKLNRAIETARQVGVASGLEESSKDSTDLEDRFKQDNVFNYNQVIPEAQESHERTFRIAETTLQERIDEKKKQIPSLERDKNQRIGDLDGRVSKLKSRKTDIKSPSWAPGCFIGGFLGFGAGLGIFLAVDARVIQMEVGTAFSLWLILPFLMAALVRAGAEILYTASLGGIKNAIKAKEREIAPLKENVLEEFSRSKMKVDGEINQLERLLEECRNRHYI